MKISRSLQLRIHKTIFFVVVDFCWGVFSTIYDIKIFEIQTNTLTNKFTCDLTHKSSLYLKFPIPLHPTINIKTKSTCIRFSFI